MGHVPLTLCLCFYSLVFFQVPLSEFEFSWSKISDIQSQVSLPTLRCVLFKKGRLSLKDQLISFFFVLQLEKLIEKNYYLHKSAQEAYKSYVRAYDSHSLKQIYSVNTLNLPMVALSFGFKVPPYVDLSILRSVAVLSVCVCVWDGGILKPGCRRCCQVPWSTIPTCPRQDRACY